MTTCSKCITAIILVDKTIYCHKQGIVMTKVQADVKSCKLFRPIINRIPPCFKCSSLIINDDDTVKCWVTGDVLSVEESKNKEGCEWRDIIKEINDGEENDEREGLLGLA